MIVPKGVAHAVRMPGLRDFMAQVEKGASSRAYARMRFSNATLFGDRFRNEKGKLFHTRELCKGNREGKRAKKG
jgi:hypothetical protein